MHLKPKAHRASPTTALESSSIDCRPAADRSLLETCRLESRFHDLVLRSISYRNSQAKTRLRRLNWIFSAIRSEVTDEYAQTNHSMLSDCCSSDVHFHRALALIRRARPGAKHRSARSSTSSPAGHRHVEPRGVRPSHR